MTILPSSLQPDPIQTVQLIEQDGLAITLMPENKTRLSLRVAPADREAFGKQIGAPLPDQIGQQTQMEGGDIACLGPDEWMLWLDNDLALSLKERALSAAVPHALVDVSSREVSLVVAGADAKELLCVGCPRNLNHFTTGKACRTLCFDVSVILWCEAEDRFRIDVWRSFAPHLASLLQQSARALAAEKRLHA
nr:sarcosine oxidase subunit gamma family protein [uncultured Cohaesibacter sp.]